MSRKMLLRIVLAAVIAAVLGSASLIIAQNGNGAAIVDVPSGFLH